MKEPRVYEIGYLLVPHIKEEDVDTKVDALRKMITDKGGLPIAEGRPELIELAYPISKDIENKRQQYTKGYFGWIKFDISPEATMTLKKEMDAQASIMRYLLITTVREDTRIGNALLAKPPHKKDEVTGEAAPYEKVVETPAEPMNEEELDKKIDELAG